MPDPVCRSKACAPHGCKRSEHRAVFEPPAWRFAACFAHRGCERFETVEPIDEPLPPLLPMRSVDGTQRARWPEEAAYWTDDADGDPGGPMRTPEPAPLEEQPQLIEEVIPDGRRLIEEGSERVEGPAPAAPPTTPSAPLAAYDAWACLECGSRAFEQWECCEGEMRPVRVEIHTREVSDG